MLKSVVKSIVPKKYIRAGKYWFFRMLPDKQYAQLRYRMLFDRPLDLRAPKTLNEKLQWLKLYDRQPIMTDLADKLKLRDYLSRTVGEKYAAPLIASFDRADKVDPAALPDVPMVLKTNHDSGTVEIVRDKATADWPAIRNRLAASLNRDYAVRQREWQYADIPRRIVVEPFLTNTDGSPIHDVKVLCMNGRAELFFVIPDLQKLGREMSFFDRDWNYQAMTWGGGTHGIDMPRPDYFEELIRVSEKLSKAFDLLRVDFFVKDNELFIGELTFHPLAGFARFEPEAFDLELGRKLTLTGLETGEETVGQPVEA